MKNIELKEIIVENFRGVRNFSCEFGGRTVISGDNATGKSTVMNAFLWCLFGKDAEDRKDHNIHPAVDNVDQRVETKVTVTLSVDGEQLELTRIYRAKYVKPKGQLEEVFKGNETELKWNGSPVTLTDYNKRLAEIFQSETVFKMLTNPLHFPSLKKDEMRKILVEVAGETSDADIAAGNIEFTAFLNELGGKNIEDFRKEVAFEVKKLKEDLATIEPKIQATKKLIPDLPDDVSGVNTELERLEKELADIDRQRTDVAAQVEEKTKLLADLMKQKAEHEAKAEAAYMQAVRYEADRVAEINAKADAIAAEIKDAEARINDKERELSRIGESINDTDADIEAKKQRLAAIGDEYRMEQSMVFDYTCPLCGGKLPAEKEAEFNTNKAARMKEIETRGFAAKKAVEDAEAERFALLDKYETAGREKHNIETALVGLNEALAGETSATAETIRKEDVKGWVENMAMAAAVQSQINIRTKEEAASVDAAVEERRHSIVQQIDEIKDVIRNVEYAAKCNDEIARLEEEGRDLAERIAVAEQRQYVALRFTSAKMHDLEYRVNALFNGIRFQLFDYTIDGNEVEVCKPIVGNTEFDTANTAAKLNAGINILSVLGGRYGLKCPVFVDNAEGIRHIEDNGLQIVELRFVKDSMLVAETI